MERLDVTELMSAKNELYKGIDGDAIFVDIERGRGESKGFKILKCFNGALWKTVAMVKETGDTVGELIALKKVAEKSTLYNALKEQGE